jgi:hypothetical protein
VGISLIEEGDPMKTQFLIVAAVVAMLAGIPGTVLAHDHNRSDLSKWFEKLHDREGICAATVAKRCICPR